MSTVTRLRAPHKIHVLSWALALEKYGSVACHFQNCQFMALSIDEMGAHYQFCKSENNKYPFVCETCNRRTDTLEKLLLHKVYSYSYMPSDEESRKIDDYLMIPIKKEISPIHRRSWEIFLEKKKYLKCLTRKCLFVTDSVEMMEDHYLSSCNETFWSQLKYECEYCLGRFLNDYDLKLHIRKAHGSKKYLMKNDADPDSQIKRLEMWSEDIMLYKQGKCFVEGCQFVDNYVKILEKHYAKCDGTRKNFIICCACGSWLLNEERLNEHRRCFHKDLDEEDYKKLACEYELESENHSGLLLDDMFADENDPHYGEAEVDSDRRTNDLKTYNGVINRISRKSSLVRSSPPVFPAKNTDSIDCMQVSDRSGIQYDSDIVEINEGSLDIIDIDSSVTKKVLNDGMKLNNRKKRRRFNPPKHMIERNYKKDNEKNNFLIFNKKKHENFSTPLEALANEMMKENKNISTVPVQIKVDNKDWTVNVSTTVVSQTKSSSEFPKNREALFKSLKEESYRLLKLVSKKNSIRNDVRMVFDPNENRITPFHINFKKGDCSNNDKDPDNLDMTKFLTSDIEDSDDDVSNSDISVCDGPDLSSNPVSLSNMGHSDVTVINKVHNLNNEVSNVQIIFHPSGNETEMAIDPTSNHSNTNVKGVDNDTLCSNKNHLPTSTCSDANIEINQFKNELNDDPHEGPSEIITLSKAHDSQLANDSLGKERNRSETGILCLSEINHLGEEVKVKNELDQQVLSKKVIDPETGSVVHIEVFGIEDDNQQCMIGKSEGGVESGNQFESEYIIPEIDFVDNSGFRCSNEQISASVSFHTDSSNSSYNSENDDEINLTEDEVLGMNSNDASQDAAGDFLTKPNEELVLLDNELRTSSLQGSESDGKGEIDPLSIDGYTDGALFYDPENDYDKNEPCPHEENSLPDNIENDNNGIAHDSKEESTDDSGLSGKWNWSNLKKYNSKTTHYDLNENRNINCKKQSSKQPNEDERFIGFSDCTDSSSKYCSFVSACNKLGYYDDMVILNQHYKIIPPNEKYLNSGTEDPDKVFRGFKSNDNYVKFRRKSIEMSRRFSEDFSRGKNKKELGLNSIVNNISNTLVPENEKDASMTHNTKSSMCSLGIDSDKIGSKQKKRSVSLDSAPKKRGRLKKDKKKLTANMIKDLIQRGNTNDTLAEIDLLESDDKSIVKHLSNQSGKEHNQQPLANISEDKTVSKNVQLNPPVSTVTDLIQCKNGSQNNTDISCDDVKELDHRSADNVSLNSNGSCFNSSLNLDLKEIDENKKTSENFADSVPRKRDRTKKKQSPLVASSLTSQYNIPISMFEGDTGSTVKEWKTVQNKEVPIVNDPYKCAKHESTPMLASNIHHETENLKCGDEVEDTGHHHVDEASLIPLDNKESILSSSVKLESVKRGRAEENQSQPIISQAAIQCNGNFDVKEENVENEESENFYYNDQLVNKEPAQEHTRPSSITSNDNISAPSKSLTSQLTNCARSVGSTQDVHSAFADEIKLTSSSVSDASFIRSNGESFLPNESVQKKSERPRKNPVQLIASTPTKSTLHLDGEGASAASENLNLFDNEESFINATVDEHNLTTSSFVSENNIVPVESVTDETTSSVLNREYKEHKPKNKVRTESTITSDSPLKRKPGRPPKRLSQSLVDSDQPQRKRCNIGDISLAKSDSGNRSLLLNSPNTKEIGQSSCREQKDADFESISTLLNRREGILESPLKPGRPAKRSSLCSEASNHFQRNNSNILDPSLLRSPTGNSSLLLNSSTDIDCSQLSCSGQKDLCNESRVVLLIEREDILKTPVKRKPGRPPKQKSKGEGEIYKEKNNVPVENLESSVNSKFILSPFSEEEESCDISQLRMNSNLKLDDQLEVKQNKPDSIKFTSGSTCNELEHMSFDDSKKKYEVDSLSSDPILKIKPDKSPELLSDSANNQEFKLDKKENDKINNSCQLNSNIVQNSTLVVNSCTSQESFPKCSRSENLESNFKPHNGVPIKNRDISSLPIKRKPGRPPKRALQHQGENRQYKIDGKEADIKNLAMDSENSIIEDELLMAQEDVLESPKNANEKIILEKNYTSEIIIERENDKNISDKEIGSTSDKSLTSAFSYKDGVSNLSISKPQLKVEEKSIETPLKRKRGRPRKRLSVTQDEIRSIKVENITVTDGDKSENSNLLNLALNMDGLSDVSHFKEVNDNLAEEGRNSFEPTPKRKPGRPPKRLSIEQQKIKKCRIETENNEDIPVRNSKRSFENGISDLLDTEDVLSNPQEDVKNIMAGEKKISLESQIKRKPGRPPKNLSLSQKSISLFQNLKIPMGYNSEPAPKRKPGRPRKVSLELKYTEENKINSSLDDMDQNVVKMENEMLFDTDNYSVNDLSNEVSVESSRCLPKRKSGRLRKVSLELEYTKENSSMDDMDHNVVKIENDMSSASGNSFNDLSNEMSYESSKCLPKRKPGRPRKVSLVTFNTKDNDLDKSSDPLHRLILVEKPSQSFESSANAEHTPQKRPGRPRKNDVETMATSTPFLNETASSLSFNSFVDIELLNDSDALEKEPKKKRGRKKGWKMMESMKKDIIYSETYYTTFNDDNLETSTIVPKQKEIQDLNSSSSFTVNLEDNCPNNVTGTDLSQETECIESELTLKQKERMKKRKLLSARVDSLTILKNPNDKVKCVTCGEIMAVIHYQRVHMLKHNFMCWLEGEKPLPLDDLDTMDTVLLRGKRANPKFAFRCEVCHMEKKSARGLLSHRQFCGKSDKEREDMMVACTNCGRLMMPASLQPHKYQCSNGDLPQPTEEPSSGPSSGPVRKAAAKCLGKIASIIEGNNLNKKTEEFHVDGDEEFDEIEEISLLYIPVLKKKANKHLMNRWKLLAGENKVLHCVIPSCKFKTYVVKDIVHHHRTCTADGSQSFSCIKCNYLCKVEDEMREHVKSCNPPIMVSQSENSEDEDHERQVIIPYLRTAELNLNMRYRALFFKPALTWMKEIYEKYFTQEPLYPDLNLNIDLWEEMDPQTSQFYNPEKSNSMMVSFQSSSWESMHALEGKVIEGNQGIAYTGGPIWGLEWCPGEGPQYLAVTSHLSMEFNFQAGSTFTGPGLIQLWSLEDISNSKSDSLSTLQFCYGVCHNDKACWNIAWCPSGGRTDTRIGLLALATTSGSIPIYAMPNPECLQHRSTRFYKPEPVLKLEIWSNERWQCSAISWSKMKPHNIIAAGFVNGMVAVWNLESQSKLARKKNILYPFKIFQAHHSIITGVCLSPESDKYLATASYDKSFKFWDLIDTTAPHTILKRGLLTSVDWLRHWMSAVTTFDNAYTMMQTTVSLSSVRGFVNPSTPVITTISSTAWCTSVNDWLNGAITSYDNGQVVLFLALRQSISQHLDKRKFSKVILNTTLHNIEAQDGPPEPNSKQKDKEIYNNNMPSNSYGDAIHKYGLAINTDPDIGRYDKFQEKASENVIDIYPLSSINRVAWNTNKNSFLYTAMGYQSGFLVVSKLSFSSKEFDINDEVSKS